jgi:hypothetical protein
MPDLPLRLRPADPPLPVRAGWLPVADPKRWLAEARRLEERSSGVVVTFYPLAGVHPDPGNSGVVITVAGNLPDGAPAFSPQVQPLGEILPGVFVPVHSTLEPALTEEEQRRFFPWSVHFIHPVLGVTGFEAGDARLPWQLLDLPTVEQAGWFAAVPGPPAAPPLRQLTLVQEAAAEAWPADEAGDIGSLGPDPKAVKPGPGLLGKAAARAAGAAGAWGAASLKQFGFGKSAASLAAWSHRQVQDLEDRRQKELNKLLDRFDKDVLDGLRHAIPLAGAEARRGTAETPGWQLGPQNPELNPFRQGSGAVDPWSIAAEIRLKLEKRYREAAANEAAAGQWGRAAYIYGALLGEWGRAAEMLEKAGRPREAARIYTERLRSGLRAAQCLEQAGLLAEAAALYQEAGSHEKAGDLMAALGQPDAARERWELACKYLSNPLEKARLLETKLNDPDRALLVLESVPLQAGQAQACFEARFALLGRLERHAAAAVLLEDLENHPGRRLEPVSAMVACLHTLHTGYPDPVLRVKAATLAPWLIGTALAKSLSRAERGRLLGWLPRFSPCDRLLARDAERFAMTKYRPAVPLLEQTSGNLLRPDRVIQLDASLQWESITDSAEGPHVLGWSPAWTAEKHYVSPVAGGVMNGQAPERITWKGFPAGAQRFSHIVCQASGSRVLAIHSHHLKTVVWQDGGGFPDDSKALTLGRAENGEFVILTVSPTGSLLAEFFGPDGYPRRTRVLDFAPPGLENGDWFTGMHGRDLWMAGMKVVCCITEKTEYQHIDLAGPVTAFAVAPPVLSSQAMAVAEGEVVLMIPHGPGRALEKIGLFSGSARKPPVVAFTNDGRAVIADADGGVIYQVADGCRKQAEIAIPPGSGELIAAAATGARGFAFLTSTGQVLGYEF